LLSRQPVSLVIVFLLLFQGAYSQWKASWIAMPGPAGQGYGVYWFRRDMRLSDVPATLPVRVSADNRYKLYVNGHLVSLGPARGDIFHWKFATIDLVPFLHTGINVIAAQVWNEGEDKPESQPSHRTAFILEGATGRQSDTGDKWQWDTDTAWLCRMDSSYAPVSVHLPFYYVAGPGEYRDMGRRVRDWAAAEGMAAEGTAAAEGMVKGAAGWVHARVVAPGVPKDLFHTFAPADVWQLVPSTLPPMELTRQRMKAVRRSEGVSVPDGWPAQTAVVTIPAHTTATILLDQGFLTNAYPHLLFGGGAGATISLTYAEALYSKLPVKGDRSVVDGKFVVGRKDSILSDGSAGQEFTTLAWRTFRYIRLRVITADQPLALNDLDADFTGYPFRENAKLQTANAEIDTMLKIGWRTARLCAVETYMDCPYYEQLQYAGDTRIQALVSLYNSGDDRLVKNAIQQLDESRLPEGVTLSRWPSRITQLIPTFSLWWIGMLHDYWMYGKDTAFVMDKLPGEREVLDYFHRWQRPDGSLRGVPYWAFTDWVNSPGWESGMAPAGADGSSSVLDLQLLWAYQLAAEMETRDWMGEYAASYRARAKQLKKTIRSKYWDAGRGLLSDRPEKDLFSQHANSLAILTGVVEGDEVRTVARRMLSDTGLAQASIYFKYYLHRALIRAGYGNDYLRWLDKWREDIRMGLTTWAEMSDVAASRSDCHAWGSSPNIEFFRTVLGVDSDAPGFSAIKVEPHPGELKNISGEMPHPNGTITASYRLQGGDWDIRIGLPPGTSGRLIWHSRQYVLKAGMNVFRLP
jgi:hypothetical protein